MAHRGAAASEAPLQVGAARVEVQAPLPAVRAGYAPPRPELSRIAAPLHARAIVLQQGDVALGVVSLDVLLVPAPLRARIEAELKERLRLSALWVAATHSHSSFGGYDRRPIAVLAGTGRFDARAEDALYDAAVGALSLARSAMKPATVERAEADIHKLLYSRSDEGPIEGKLTGLRFVADGAVLAEWLIAAGHPTFVPRDADALDPDYPGRLSLRREAERSAAVSVFTQGAGGNATAVAEGAPPEEAAEAFARLLDDKSDGLAWKPADSSPLAFVAVELSLPRPDSSRLAPFGLRAILDNTMCVRAERTAQISLWRLGGVTLLSVPAEPTYAAGQRLLDAAGATRVVGLVNGYIGYVEPRERIERNEGEARRQYFRPELLERLVAAATLAAQSLP